MNIKTNSAEISVKNLISETMQHNGKNYPALRVVFDGGVTAAEIDALCSGTLEIIDENGAVVGVQDGYTTRGEHSLVIGKITVPEQERDELAAALAVEEAKKPYIDTLTAGLDDATASTVIPLYPEMRYDGGPIKSGTRINWNGALKRAAANLWDRPDCNPDNAPELWEDINYRDGYRIIPEMITAGLAFADGEKGWWTDGLLYESLADNNVYTPDEYPANWREVTE